MARRRFSGSSATRGLVASQSLPAPASQLKRSPVRASMTPAQLWALPAAMSEREGSGPADGDDEVDGTAIFNSGEGASGGVEAGSSAGGDPFFFFGALGPEVDGAAGGVGPVADEGFEFAGHGGDYGYSGHGCPADSDACFPTLAAQGWCTRPSWRERAIKATAVLHGSLRHPRP